MSIFLKIDQSTYDYNYFEHGLDKGISGYTNYRWIPELTLIAAHSILRFCCLYDPNIILDYGCAKGFLCRAFTMLGINSYGLDLSSYAIKNADPTISDKLFLLTEFNTYDRILNDICSVHGSPIDLVTYKDVLEHIPEQQIIENLSCAAKYAKLVWASIPLGIDNISNRFVINDYHNDKTHITIKNESWWAETFRSAGLNIIKSSFQCPGVKDNWYRINPKGNIFILAKSNCYE